MLLQGCNVTKSCNATAKLQCYCTVAMLLGQKCDFQSMLICVPFIFNLIKHSQVLADIKSGFDFLWSSLHVMTGSWTTSMKPARVQTSIYQYFESKINQSEVEQDTDVQYLGATFNKATLVLVSMTVSSNDLCVCRVSIISCSQHWCQLRQMTFVSSFVDCRLQTLLNWMRSVIVSSVFGLGDWLLCRMALASDIIWWTPTTTHCCQYTTSMVCAQFWLMPVRNQISTFETER